MRSVNYLNQKLIQKNFFQTQLFYHFEEGLLV